jgi:hypothetical protein
VTGTDDQWVANLMSTHPLMDVKAIADGEAEFVWPAWLILSFSGFSYVPDEDIKIARFEQQLIRFLPRALKDRISGLLSRGQKR